MSFMARFEELTEFSDRRSSPRRTLRLEATGFNSSTLESQVLVHDISEGGLLIESSAPLSLGSEFNVQLPEAGILVAKVIWNSHSFFGCRFAEPVPKAALSAALLQSAAVGMNERKASYPFTDALSELKVLSERVRQVRVTIDKIIDELSETAPAEQQHDLARSCETGDVDAADSEVEARPSFATRLRVILGLSVALWALILWVAGVF